MIETLWRKAQNETYHSDFLEIRSFFMTDTSVNQDPKPLDIEDNQPNDPAEGPREDDKEKADSKVPSTHVPDTRAFDL